MIPVPRDSRLHRDLHALVSGAADPATTIPRVAADLRKLIGESDVDVRLLPPTCNETTLFASY